MIEMARQSEAVLATVAKANGKPEQWIERYVAPDGWHRLDQAQRRLETLLAAIEDEKVSDAAVARCRAKYDEVVRQQAEGFIEVYENAAWSIAGVLPQHRLWAEIVAALPKFFAVVAVDAMRYEIGGAKLGYVTDLDIVVPKSVSVFKAGGDLAYHHGGASLQELVIPVITVRMKPATASNREEGRRRSSSPPTRSRTASSRSRSRFRAATCSRSRGGCAR